MATQKLSLIDCFIHLNFEKVYDEICHGVVGQRASRSELDNIEDYKLKWNTHADKREVLECIRTFFHVCLNAHRVGSEYEEIPEWISAMTKIACARRNHRIVSSYQYRILLSASEQITRFLFSTFDWGINDMDESQSNRLSQNGQAKEVSYLNTFDSRIWYYTHYKGTDKKESERREFDAGTKLWNTAQLLYAMKEQRNGMAHLAKRFYTDRPVCLQRLVYQLYDYITIFFMLSRRCKEKDGNGHVRMVRLSEEIKKKVELTPFSSAIDISIECVETTTNKQILGREGDVRLYKVDEKGTATLVAPSPSSPSTYLVTYFDRYQIRIMTAGAMSQPSEMFTIDQDYVNGTIVQVSIPPKGAPKPQKISIREIILFSEEDLPDDVRNLLTDMEEYAGQHEDYVKLARALVLASATNSEKDRSEFESAVAKIKDSLTKEMRKNMPQDVASFLQCQVTAIHSAMAAPYINKADFEQLCDAIDSIYDDFKDLFSSSYDKDMPLIEQLYRNAKSFLDGNPLKVGTTASEEQLKVQKDIQDLEFILSMHDKYPDIIEAEFGNDWLQKRIIQLYEERVDRFKNEVRPLRIYVRHLYHLIQKEPQSDENRLPLKYAERLYDVTLGAVDEILWSILSCRHTLLFWIDQCGSSTNENVKDLSQKCRDEVNRLSEDYVLLSQLPQIPVDESDKLFLTEKLQILRDKVKELKKGIDTYHRKFEEISKTVLEKRKKEWGFWRHLQDWERVPEETKDLRSEMMFESFSDIVSNCSPIQLMQLICCAHIHPFMLSGNSWVSVEGCEELGISSFGLYDEWLPAYHEWVEKNKEILKACEENIQAIRQRFSDRERKHPNLSANSANDQKSSQIVAYQIQQIEAHYGDAIPDYIRDIINAKETALPNAVKARFLEKVLEPNASNPTENLLFVIDAVIRFDVFFQGWNSWGLLAKYINSDYSERLVSPEGQSDFKKMKKSSQRVYLHLLMNQDYPMLLGKSSGTRFALAYQLNFPQGETGQGLAIARDEFMRLMSQFRLNRIFSYDIHSFNDSYNVVTKVLDYYAKQPKQKGWSAYAVPQLVDFKFFIKGYFDQHVVVNETEKGERPDIKIGILNPLHEALKGKSPMGELAFKYSLLYRARFVELKNKSGWCEVEQEVFTDILEKLPDANPQEQQEVSDTLYKSMTSLRDGTRCDVIANRLIALRPFCRPEQFDEYLGDFYKYCSYHEMGIFNPPVIKGLTTIYELFYHYGQNVKDSIGSTDFPSWHFVGILINIHNILEWYDGLFQEINAKESRSD